MVCQVPQAWLANRHTGTPTLNVRQILTLFPLISLNFHHVSDSKSLPGLTMSPLVSQLFLTMSPMVSQNSPCLHWSPSFSPCLHWSPRTQHVSTGLPVSHLVSTGLQLSHHVFIGLLRLTMSPQVSQDSPCLHWSPSFSPCLHWSPSFSPCIHWPPSFSPCLH